MAMWQLKNERINNERRNNVAMCQLDNVLNNNLDRMII